MTKAFAKIVDCIQPLTVFTKQFILFVSQGYEYASDKTKQYMVCCHLFHKKTRAAISANLFLNYISFSHYYLTVRH